MMESEREIAVASVEAEGAPRERAASSVDLEEKPELLERLGLRFLKRRAGVRADGRSSAIPASKSGRAHLLSREEQRELVRIEIFTIVRAALAGAFFGAVGGVGEIFARNVLDFDEGAEYLSVGNFFQFWGIVGVFVVVSTVGEILFLYWDGLRGVHRLAQVAGVTLFPNEASPQTTEHTAVAGALARAALELPNPKESPFGIDPLREASKLRLTIATLIYKAKRGVTNVLVKILIRRLSTRAAARTFLPLLAVPVFAAWNAYTVWVVMREARIRALGASAARQLVDALFAAFGGSPGKLSDAGKLATLRAVGSAIVRQQDLHPNVLALLREIVRRVGEPAEGERVDDTRGFLDALPGLPPSEQALALSALEAAMIVDCRFTRRDEALYVQAHQVAGKPADATQVRARMRSLLRGEPL